LSDSGWQGTIVIYLFYDASLLPYQHPVSFEYPI